MALAFGLINLSSLNIGVHGITFRRERQHLASSKSPSTPGEPTKMQILNEDGVKSRHRTFDKPAVLHKPVNTQAIEDIVDAEESPDKPASLPNSSKTAPIEDGVESWENLEPAASGEDLEKHGGFSEAREESPKDDTDEATSRTEWWWEKPLRGLAIRDAEKPLLKEVEATALRLKYVVPILSRCLHGVHRKGFRQLHRKGSIRVQLYLSYFAIGESTLGYTPMHSEIALCPITEGGSRRTGCTVFTFAGTNDGIMVIGHEQFEEGNASFVKQYEIDEPMLCEDALTLLCGGFYGARCPAGGTNIPVEMGTSDDAAGDGIGTSDDAVRQDATRDADAAVTVSQQSVLFRAFEATAAVYPMADWDANAMGSRTGATYESLSYNCNWYTRSIVTTLAAVKGCQKAGCASEDGTKVAKQYFEKQKKQITDVYYYNTAENGETTKALSKFVTRPLALAVRRHGFAKQGVAEKVAVFFSREVGTQMEGFEQHLERLEKAGLVPRTEEQLQQAEIDRTLEAGFSEKGVESGSDDGGESSKDVGCLSCFRFLPAFGS
jgi:hypothetical protein